MSSSLENEDLDNVPLVRMEDVQPSRERFVDCRSPSKDEEQSYEACVIDDIECANECVVNDDDDSNIGSMVSLQSEDVYEEDSSSQELIIPEVLKKIKTENPDEFAVYDTKVRKSNCETYVDNLEKNNDFKPKVEPCIDEPLEGNDIEQQVDATVITTRQVKSSPKCYTAPKLLKPVRETEIEAESPAKKAKIIEEVVLKPPSESWPILEILPGGVIKTSDKLENETNMCPDKIEGTVSNTGDMMYACAKCSQTFKYLFCLVKHVKWHEDMNKIMKDPEMCKMTATEKELVNLKRERNDLDKIYKKQKLEVLTRVAVAIGKLGSNPEKILNK